MTGDIDSDSSLWSKWGKRSLLILGIVGLVGVAILIAVKRQQQIQRQAKEISPEVIAQEAPVTAVSALGRIEPQDEVIKVAAPPSLGGARIEKLLVKEGEQVTSGQIIAILDNRDRKLADVAQARQEIEVAQANLNIVKAGAKQGEIEAQRATIERLEAQLRGEITSNRAKIARLEAELQTKKDAQQANIALLEAELSNAESEFKRYDQLAQSGAIAASTLDNRRLTLNTAQERLKQSKANLQEITTTIQQQLAEARAVARQSEETLQKQIIEEKANLNKISEVRTVDVAKAAAEVQRAIASLQQAQADLEQSSVKSPETGTILKIHARTGENVNALDGILELGQTQQMMVIAEVYESDIKKVKLGQQVIIKSENNSFTGELTGKVDQIGLQIGKTDVLNTDPAADVDVRVVEVKILLDSEASKVVSGLTYAKVITKILL